MEGYRRREWLDCCQAGRQGRRYHVGTFGYRSSEVLAASIFNSILNKALASRVTHPGLGKQAATIPLEQRPRHRRHLTARSRKLPCQAQLRAARGERCDFFGAEQVRQVSAQLTAQSFADTIDAFAFFCG